MADSDRTAPRPGGNAAGQRFAAAPSIGHRSRALKRQHLLGRVWRVILGVVAVILAAMVAGLVLGGIGFGGLFFTALACVLVAALLLRYPRLKVPTREQLAEGPVREVVGQTELWLEATRGELPPLPAQLVGQIGFQLDGLGHQLDHADERQPAMAEIRKLIGEYLPGIIASYIAIPPHLRGISVAGTPDPDEALSESLERISREIDTITRQLATGSIDDLAIKARYLDYRYGAALGDGNGAQAPSPAPHDPSP